MEPVPDLTSRGHLEISVEDRSHWPE